MKLENKVALVTGGNSGIGKAIAKMFADEGASVVINGRDKKTLDETAGESNGRIVAEQGDVSSLEDLDRLYGVVKNKFGRLDVLVVNAGVARFAPAANVTEEMFDEISDINFKGAFFTAQKAIPLLSDGAAVILVSSVLNNAGMAGASVYSATKAALRSLARTLAAELAGRGIRVNTLSPGPVQTPIYGKLGMSQEEMSAFADQVKQGVPLKRFGDPEEMAGIALFLASNDSSYMTGAEVCADGGFKQV